MKKVNWSKVTQRAVDNYDKPEMPLESKATSVDMVKITKQVQDFMASYSEEFGKAFSAYETQGHEFLKSSLETFYSQHPSRLRVERYEADPVEVDICHYHFEKLVRMVGVRVNVALIGEAGSGKTHGAEQCAEVLGLQHYTMSFHAKMTSTDLRGYCDAVGKYNPSPIYTALKFGGVLILDEFDRANTEVTVSLNNLLAGKSYMFPNGENVPKHPDFIVIACQNTTGHGGSKQYASASRQDGATLNRFVKLEWNTDEALERIIAGDTDVTNLVQRIRRKNRELGMDLIISPRQSIDANKLVSAGFSIEDAIHHTIMVGLSDDQQQRLLN